MSMCLCLNGVTQMRAVSNNAIKIQNSCRRVSGGEILIYRVRRKDNTKIGRIFPLNTTTTPSPIPVHGCLTSRKSFQFKLCRHTPSGDWRITGRGGPTARAAFMRAMVLNPAPASVGMGRRLHGRRIFGYDASPAEYSDIYVAETTR